MWKACCSFSSDFCPFLKETSKITNYLKIQVFNAWHIVLRGEHRAGTDPVPTKPDPDCGRNPKPTPDPDCVRLVGIGWSESGRISLLLIGIIPSRPVPTPDFAGIANRLPNRLIVGIGIGPAGWSESGRKTGGGRFCSPLHSLINFPY